MEAGEEKGGWETGFLFLDFYGYRENGLVWSLWCGTHLKETSTKEKAKKQNFEIT